MMRTSFDDKTPMAAVLLSRLRQWARMAPIGAIARPAPIRRVLFLAVVLTMVVGLSACDLAFDDREQSTFRCEAAQDCNGLSGTEGKLCLGGLCSECASDWQCAQVPFYGAGARCTAGRCVVNQDQHDEKLCTAGLASCPCRIDGSCRRSLVCDTDTSVCRPPKTCTDVGCGDLQACIASAEGRDATCASRCSTGFDWDEASRSCIKRQATCAGPSSIVNRCAADGRECDDTLEAGARCGACLDGYLPLEGRCDKRVDCVELNCALQGRSCVGEPNGRCDTCLPGFVEDAANERCLVTCAQLSCGEREVCVESTEDMAAFCTVAGGRCPPVPACDAQQAWNPMWAQCQDCGNLDCSDGSKHTGSIFPLVTNQFRCICETKPGYYFDNTTLSTEACDADGDGWVRRSAWDPINRDVGCSSLGDPACDCALGENARCRLRSIDRVVLHNIYGQTEEVLLTEDTLLGAFLDEGRLALYEVDGNDDVSLRTQPMPVYASGGAVDGTPLSAGAVNSLTKACVNLTADFNGNGYSDISEYQGMGSIPGPAWLLPFVHLGYFVELYESWYTLQDSDERLPGQLHIRERARRVDEGSAAQLPLFSPLAASYAQSCHRMVDADYAERPSAGRPNIGMDFARFNSIRDDPGQKSIARMGHHSQFKCLSLVDVANSGRAAPQEITLITAEQDYTLHSCWLSEGAADLTCRNLNPGETGVGDVLWGSAAYGGYEQEVYVRGCVNECSAREVLNTSVRAADPLFCADEAERTGCYGDPENFGQYACGCKEGLFKGFDCSIPCGPWYVDGDTDGYRDVGSAVVAQGCSAPNSVALWQEGVDLGEECSGVPTASSEASIYPNAPELCDDFDNNCNGTTNEGFAELCGDSVDNDCDGDLNEGFEDLGKGCVAGVGACWRAGVWACEPSERLTMPCSVQAGVGVEGFNTSAFATGAQGPTWDWNCDGEEELQYASDGILENYIRDINVWDQRTPNNNQSGEWFVIYSFPIIDAHKFCAEQLDTTPVDTIAGESPEVRADRIRGEQETACGEDGERVYTLTARGEPAACGDRIVRIRCALSDYLGLKLKGTVEESLFVLGTGSSYASLSTSFVTLPTGVSRTTATGLAALLREARAPSGVGAGVGDDGVLLLWANRTTIADGRTPSILKLFRHDGSDFSIVDGATGTYCLPVLNDGEAKNYTLMLPPATETSGTRALSFQSAVVTGFAPGIEKAHVPKEATWRLNVAKEKVQACR